MGIFTGSRYPINLCSYAVFSNLGIFNLWQKAQKIDSIDIYYQF